MKSNNSNSNQYTEIKNRQTILLVDPNDIMHRVLSLAFHEGGDYIIESACCCEEAIEKAGSLKGRIDLLLLNFVLPDMSGYELYKELSKANLLGNVPTLFHSGMLNVPHEIQELIRAGKAEIIYKPYNSIELFTAIDMLMLKFAQ